MTSRKWPDSAARELHCFSVWAWVARPIRAAKNGSRGRVSSTIRPLTQSTKNSVASASTGTKAPATSAGRKRAAYGSTEAAPWAARVTARSGAGRRSAGAASHRSTSRPRRATVTSTPTQAATRSEVQASTARTPNRPASQRAGVRSEVLSTTATMSAAIAMARPMVATPCSTPTTARTATGRRAAGAVLSRRGSKGLIGGGRRLVRARGPRRGCSASRAACGRPSRCSPCR